MKALEQTYLFCEGLIMREVSADSENVEENSRGGNDE